MHSEENQFYTALAVAVTILVLIIIYFIITMVRHQRNNLLLHRSNLRAEISTLENERKRIASDLHDELGPLLSTVRIHINHLDSDDKAEQEVIGKSSQLIDEVISKIREISYNLLPNTLIRHGLVRAVEEYIRKLAGAHELQITLKCSEDFRLPPETEVNIYRIIQEITHNTIKHAHATQLGIELRREGNQLLLTTADNGSGFDYEEKRKESKGLGLVNLQSRAEVMNATFVFRSEPKLGSNYFFEIPLNQPL